MTFFLVFVFFFALIAALTEIRSGETAGAAIERKTREFEGDPEGPQGFGEIYLRGCAFCISDLLAIIGVMYCVIWMPGFIQAAAAIVLLFMIVNPVINPKNKIWLYFNRASTAAVYLFMIVTVILKANGRV